MALGVEITLEALGDVERLEVARLGSRMRGTLRSHPATTDEENRGIDRYPIERVAEEGRVGGSSAVVGP